MVLSLTYICPRTGVKLAGGEALSSKLEGTSISGNSKKARATGLNYKIRVAELGESVGPTAALAPGRRGLEFETRKVSCDAMLTIMTAQTWVIYRSGSTLSSLRVLWIHFSSG